MIEFLFVLFVGLAFGSFITCASWRLPREEDIVVKPSYCPTCNAKLGFKDLWPVFSWVASKGKCRHCKASVSARYPITELITGGLFLFIYARYGLTLQGIILAMMGVALLIMIVVDLEHYIIPDQVHWVLLPLGVAWHYTVGTPWSDVALGFAVGLGLGLLLHHGYRVLRKKEGLGFGDVKFFAVVGLWLTLKPFVPFLFFSGIFGIVTALIWRFLKRGPIFPFGPALAVALFLCIAYPEVPDWFWSFGGLIQK
jgi:leader peptidase (prepilin peptidase) / N-methyltransferase